MGEKLGKIRTDPMHARRWPIQEETDLLRSIDHRFDFPYSDPGTRKGKKERSFTIPTKNQ